MYNTYNIYYIMILIYVLFLKYYLPSFPFSKISNNFSLKSEFIILYYIQSKIQDRLDLIIYLKEYLKKNLEYTRELLVKFLLCSSHFARRWK